MKFSIILPSLLADYPGAATGRPAKLMRAIKSTLSQSFTDFELIVISDGCDLTTFLVKGQFNDSRIKLLRVERERLFSNTPRNFGIAHASGEYIIYIDNDDTWGPDHLKKVNEGIAGEDWVYFGDWVPDGRDEQGQIKWRERVIDVTQYGRCGTSNICHASRLGLTWKESEGGYGHDFLFIQQLRQFANYKFIGSSEYYVCHFMNGGGV